MRASCSCRATHNGGAPAYDPRGNIESEGGRSFLYSSENLLTGHAATIAGVGRTFTWTYDPLMRLYHQTTTGLNSRTYAMDGDNARPRLRPANATIRLPRRRMSRG